MADDVTVDVVDLDGDRVRRLADAAHAAAHRPLRLAWNGVLDGGARAPDGQYRVRVALRDEGRSSVIQQTMTLDDGRRARWSASALCAKPRKGNIVAPARRAESILFMGVARAYRTQFNVLGTDSGRAEAGHDVPHARPAPPRGGDGARDLGARAPTSSVRPCATGRATSARPRTAEVGAVPGGPASTVRGLAVQPPLRPVTAGQRARVLHRRPRRS